VTASRLAFLATLLCALVLPDVLFAGDSKGRQAEKCGRYREALHYYQSYLGSYSPGTRDDFINRKRIIRVVKKLALPPVVSDEALAAMEKGRQLVKAADYKEAESAFQQAADLAPWWGNAYFNLALTQDMLRMRRPAIYSFKLYLETNPDAPDAGFVNNRMEELKQTAINAKNARPHIQKGLSLYSAKKYGEAVTELQRAIELDPDRALAHAVLGHAYFKQDLFEECIPEFVDALRLGKKEMTIYVCLAYAYNQLGDPGLAVDYLNEGLKEDPNGRNAKLARSNLPIYRENLAHYNNMRTRTGPLGKQIHFTFTVAMMMPNPSDSLSIEVKNDNTGTRADSDLGFLFNIDADWRMSSFTSVGLSVIALEATIHEKDFEEATLKTFAFGGQFKFMVPITAHLEFRGGIFGGIAMSTHTDPMHPGGTEVKMDDSMGLLGGFSFEVGYYLKPLGFIGEILGITAEFGVVGQPFGWVGKDPNTYSYTLPPLFYLGLGFEAAI